MEGVVIEFDAADVPVKFVFPQNPEYAWENYIDPVDVIVSDEKYAEDIKMVKEFIRNSTFLPDDLEFSRPNLWPSLTNVDEAVKKINAEYPEYNVEPIWSEMMSEHPEGQLTYGVYLGGGMVETFDTEEEAREEAKEKGLDLVAKDATDPLADFAALDF